MAERVLMKTKNNHIKGESNRYAVTYFLLALEGYYLAVCSNNWTHNYDIMPQWTDLWLLSDIRQILFLIVTQVYTLCGYLISSLLAADIMDHWLLGSHLLVGSNQVLN